MRFSPAAKKLLVYVLCFAFLAAPLGCTYKPGYLQKSEKTPISERWKVVKINERKLSNDEAEVFKAMGPPQYVRFYRHLTNKRERVYEWVYTEPVRLVSFMDGKKLEYVVLDDNPTFLNEKEKNFLFWSGIGAGAVGGLGLLYFLLLKK